MSRPVGRPQRYVVWMADGFQFFLGQLSKIDDDRLDRPSCLPGWTRKHVVSHVGFNARAARRLVQWAKTGEVTPMYSSASARTDEIAEGALWGGARLRKLVEQEQAALSTEMDALSDDNWSAEVVTGQGRTISATEIPWIRAREVWIHAVDLNAGGDFADFPAVFVDKLIDDAVAKHRAGNTPTLEVRPTDRDDDRPVIGYGANAAVEGAASDLARWLTRREPRGLRTSDGTPLPELGPWL
jgi:maleylpyruvate isomerase